jgi:hypothetical protein
VMLRNPHGGATVSDVLSDGPQQQWSEHTP